MAFALAAALALVVWSLAPGQPEARSAADIAGMARVLDGDTVEISGVRIRLEGIDAPEAAQRCTHRVIGTWACGAAATNELVRLVDGKPLTCTPLGTDKYGRTLATCHLGTLDVNAEMVRLGLAWAFVKYSTTYVSVEAEARAKKVGVFQTDTMTPWDFRAGTWRTAEEKAPAGCAIKGNVTANGRIYHMPWSPWYAKIRMDLDKGKRWFCSEEEAIAAGWRPAMSH
ncbi:MAG TPA: thermonuclease family protein [Hyphomicrobiaceae bacterium]|nr:thermonuclease family protein [Hyphomicrobiaceae bacterium]